VPGGALGVQDHVLLEVPVESLRVPSPISPRADTSAQRELAIVSGERDRLAQELVGITSSIWWRMRRPFEPALRIRRKLLRRL
jgi:hypothetical protein